MREDEKFVADALAKWLGGTFREGENPPDAYLVVGADTIAVEISTLTQSVRDDLGERPRLSDDIAVARLAKRLNTTLKDVIAEGRCLVLTLGAPMLEIRKTEAELKRYIRDGLGGASSGSVSIRGNTIGFSVYSHDVPSEKVMAVIEHRGAGASRHILTNAWCILEGRIVDKTQKCAHLTHRPLWLALLNDYFLADAETYRAALSRISRHHPFDRILVVSGDGAVEALSG